jgi:Transposase IS116/IS110/IS902 family
LVVLNPTNWLGRKEPNMIIMGVDFHPEFQQIAWVDSDTGEFQEKRLAHRMVQARTRIMNQLQAVALNEGLRCKKRLWRKHGREQLESFRLVPWASRRRRDLLELLDRLNPTIAERSQAIEQEAEKFPEARRLMTHPGVGALTAFAFVLIIGKADRFECGKQVASYLGRIIDWAARSSFTRGVRSSNHDQGCDRRDAWVGPSVLT